MSVEGRPRTTDDGRQTTDDGRQTTEDSPRVLTKYFTFGQQHTHSVNGHTMDKDCVIKITAVNPRLKMHELFVNKWAFEHDEIPEMHYFHRGIYFLNEDKWI